jgi:hypothetical protein
LVFHLACKVIVTHQSGCQIKRRAVRGQFLNRRWSRRIRRPERHRHSTDSVAITTAGGAAESSAKARGLPISTLGAEPKGLALHLSVMNRFKIAAGTRGMARAKSILPDFLRMDRVTGYSRAIRSRAVHFFSSAAPGVPEENQIAVGRLRSRLPHARIAAEEIQRSLHARV